MKQPVTFSNSQNLKNSSFTVAGFTLVELIVVITILAILATVGFLSLSGYSDDARTATVKANVRTVYSAILTESTTSGNSPRYYVDHGTGAALSWAFVFVDGKQVALTGGNVGEVPTDSNYTAGNPRWGRLRMNGEKFRLSSAELPEAGASGSAGGLPYAFGGFGTLGSEASAAYSTGELAVGAVDVFKTGANGKKRATPYFQVAGVVPGSKVAVVSGNLSGGTADGLIKDPSVSDASYALVDGSTFSAVPENCLAIKKANPSATDGTYRIDPDGNGPASPFSVSCDMTTDWGGWMLLDSKFSDYTTWTNCTSGYGVISASGFWQVSAENGGWISSRHGGCGIQWRNSKAIPFRYLKVRDFSAPDNVNCWSVNFPNVIVGIVSADSHATSFSTSLHYPGWYAEGTNVLYKASWQRSSGYAPNDTYDAMVVGSWGVHLGSGKFDNCWGVGSGYVMVK